MSLPVVLIADKLAESTVAALGDQVWQLDGALVEVAGPDFAVTRGRFETD